jgi:hypothetical protein
MLNDSPQRLERVGPKTIAEKVHKPFLKLEGAIRLVTYLHVDGI